MDDSHHDDLEKVGTKLITMHLDKADWLVVLGATGAIITFGLSLYQSVEQKRSRKFKLKFWMIIGLGLLSTVACICALVITRAMQSEQDTDHLKDQKVWLSISQQVGMNSKEQADRIVHQQLALITPDTEAWARETKANENKERAEWQRASKEKENEELKRQLAFTAKVYPTLIFAAGFIQLAANSLGKQVNLTCTNQDIIVPTNLMAGRYRQPILLWPEGETWEMTINPSPGFVYVSFSVEGTNIPPHRFYQLNLKNPNYGEFMASRPELVGTNTQYLWETIPYTNAEPQVRVMLQEAIKRELLSRKKSIE